MANISEYTEDGTLKGGATGDVLTKNTAVNGDYSWAPAGGGGGGIANASVFSVDSATTSSAGVSLPSIFFDQQVIYNKTDWGNNTDSQISSGGALINTAGFYNVFVIQEFCNPNAGDAGVRLTIKRNATTTADNLHVETAIVKPSTNKQLIIQHTSEFLAGDIIKAFAATSLAGVILGNGANADLIGTGNASTKKVFGQLYIQRIA